MIFLFCEVFGPPEKIRAQIVGVPLQFHIFEPKMFHTDVLLTGEIKKSLLRPEVLQVGHLLNCVSTKRDWTVIFKELIFQFITGLAAIAGHFGAEFYRSLAPLILVRFIARSANAIAIAIAACFIARSFFIRSEKLEKTETVDFEKHPAQKVGTRSRAMWTQCCRQVCLSQCPKS